MHCQASANLWSCHLDDSNLLRQVPFSINLMFSVSTITLLYFRDGKKKQDKIYFYFDCNTVCTNWGLCSIQIRYKGLLWIIFVMKSYLGLKQGNWDTKTVRDNKFPDNDPCIGIADTYSPTCTYKGWFLVTWVALFYIKTLIVLIENETMPTVFETLMRNNQN